MTTPTETKTITRILVSLNSRKLSAFAGEEQVFNFNCMIGREGHETQPGTFHVFKKEKMHLSHAYGGTPMPFSMFFSGDGKAIHGTPLAGPRSYAGYILSNARTYTDRLGLGQIAPFTDSHGCVGLSNGEAEELFKVTPLNTVIQIVT